MASGRCRFRLPADVHDAVEGTAVRVVPLPDPPDLPVPLDIQRPPESQPAVLPAAASVAGAAARSAPEAGPSQPAASGRRRRRGWEDSCSSFSSAPGWCWKMFDAFALAVSDGAMIFIQLNRSLRPARTRAGLRRAPRPGASDVVVTKERPPPAQATLREMPAVKAAAAREAALVRAPTALAYWAAEHLPLDNGNRQALLEAPSTVERLRLLIKLAATVEGVHCRRWEGPPCSRHRACQETLVCARPPAR